MPLRRRPPTSVDPLYETFIQCPFFHFGVSEGGGRTIFSSPSDVSDLPRGLGTHEGSAERHSKPDPPSRCPWPKIREDRKHVPSVGGSVKGLTVSNSNTSGRTGVDNRLEKIYKTRLRFSNP